MTLVVNMCAGPGSGKSVLAADVFSALKKAGYNAELVSEFAKDAVHEERTRLFESQIYIFGKQNYKMSRLVDRVDVIVTDSPVFLPAYYEKFAKQVFEGFRPLVKEIFDSYKNFNVWINSGATAETYQREGRFQTFDASQQVSRELQTFMSDMRIYVDMYVNPWTENRVPQAIAAEVAEIIGPPKPRKR